MGRKHPAKKINKKSICFAYENDLDQIYAFYCARYENVSFKDFMNLGFEEFSKKLSSIPEEEPLFKIIKSRMIKLSQIKDKEERKYWRSLKNQNKIPQLYLSDDEINMELKEIISNGNELNKI